MILWLIITTIACIGFFIAAKVLYEAEGDRTKASNICAATGICLYIAHAVLKIATNYTLFTIPWLLLLATICLFIIFVSEYDIDDAWPSFIVGVIAISAYVITGLIYLENVVACEPVEQSVTSTKVICEYATENKEENSMGIYYICSDFYTEEYKFYIKQEDGGIEQQTLEEDQTTIYYVDSIDEVRWEVVEYKTYYINKNRNPAEECLESTVYKNKLYVLEGSIITIYRDKLDTVEQSE